jgi:hypothetical protein
MNIRKLLGLVPVVAVLALAAPVASASASTTPVSTPGSQIPCYPYPAFCGPNGQPWFGIPYTFQPITFPPFHLPGPLPLPIAPVRVGAPS